MNSKDGLAPHRPCRTGKGGHVLDADGGWPFLMFSECRTSVDLGDFWADSRPGCAWGGGGGDDKTNKQHV